MIEVKNLKKIFEKEKFLRKEKITVLKGISFKVDREVFGFIGPNGAGKTTTIKIIMDFIKPTSGEVRVFGKNINEVKEKVGFLPERPFIYSSIKGIEYLQFCCDVYGIPYFERKKKISKLLELVDLVGAEEKTISSYSKGMVQRLLFASTLINDPDLLILDEPMSGLDPIGRSIIANVIKDLKSQGKTVFYSSHIIQDVERLSDRVAVIIDGEIKLCDSVSSIVSKYLKGYLITFKENMQLKTEEVKKDHLWMELEKLKSMKCEIVSVEPLRLSLEDIFVKLVKGEGIESSSNSKANS